MKIKPEKLLRKLISEKEEREGGWGSKEREMCCKAVQLGLAHIITTMQRAKYIQWLSCSTKLISRR